MGFADGVKWKNISREGWNEVDQAVEAPHLTIVRGAEDATAVCACGARAHCQEERGSVPADQTAAFNKLVEEHWACKKVPGKKKVALDIGNVFNPLNVWPKPQVSVLFWDKPEKKMPVEDWKTISADGAPPGVYTPNMSEADMKKWKAKLCGHTTAYPRVEIRKSTSHHAHKPGDYPKDGVSLSAQVLIIVGLGRGHKFKDYAPELMAGVDVQISMNGQSTFTMQEMTELYAAVQEARLVLEKLRAMAVEQSAKQAKGKKRK